MNCKKCKYNLKQYGDLVHCKLVNSTWSQNPCTIVDDDYNLICDPDTLIIAKVIDLEVMYENS